MKTTQFLALPLLTFASLASAQMAPASSTSSHNPAIKSPAVARTAIPANGANSFSEAQARGRFAKAGYTGVTALAKEYDGAWTAAAMKGNKRVYLALDYKGNVTTVQRPATATAKHRAN